MVSSYFGVLVVLLGAALAEAKGIPPYLTLCRYHDPKLETCVLRAVEQIRPHLAKGVPEMYLPPFDPFVLPAAGLESGNFKASFKNIQIYHMQDFKIEHLKLDLDNVFVNLTLRFDKLMIRSEYNIDGRILILQLHGNGPSSSNYTNVWSNVICSGRKYQKKGKEYMQVGISQLDLKLGKPVFQFDNIFPDQELTIQTNRIINENIEDILSELQPVIQKTITQFVSGIIGRIFNRFSIDELFPK